MKTYSYTLSQSPNHSDRTLTANSAPEGIIKALKIGLNEQGFSLSTADLNTIKTRLGAVIPKGITPNFQEDKLDDFTINITLSVSGKQKKAQAWFFNCGPTLNLSVKTKNCDENTCVHLERKPITG